MTGICEKSRIRRFEREDCESVLNLHEAGLREMGTLIEEPGFYEDLLDIEGEYLRGDEGFLVGVCEVGSWRWGL